MSENRNATKEEKKAQTSPQELVFTARTYITCSQLISSAAAAEITTTRGMLATGIAESKNIKAAHLVTVRCKERDR